MSESNESLREELIENKNDKEFRHGYADENLNATIATQIKVLREERDWKQEDLANEAGMKQPMISRYENVNYSSWSINTLKKLAEAFDVYLDVRFRSFRELVDLADNFSREILQVPKFTEDPYFSEAKSQAETPDNITIDVGDAVSTQEISDIGAHGSVDHVLGALTVSSQVTTTKNIMESLNPSVSSAEKLARAA